MSLARITERIQEEKERKEKIDGRRFNSRSQKKMMWQVKDIQSLRKKKKTSSRGGYSKEELEEYRICLLYTSPSPRDATLSRMPSSA